MIVSFLLANKDLILFVYGLVFFELGLAIALQSRTHSRLDLARSLKWLALFGLSHGLHEWGDLFIPIQTSYLAAPLIQFLRILQLILLAGSFTFLFEFGVALLRPLGRSTWLHGLSIGLFVGWLVLSFFIILPFLPAAEIWNHTSNALARYGIGFPGSVLAAYGLSRYARIRIAPLGEPRFVRALTIAAISLAIYSIFGGLVPPPISFFPGNLLNTVTFEQTFGFHPIIMRSLTGLVLAIATIRGLEVFDLETERQIEEMEIQQILTVERDRIGRDLHDGAIQKVFTAGLLVESAAHLAKPKTEISTRLQRAELVLNDAISDLRLNLDELRPNIHDEPLQASLEKIATDPRFQSLVEIELDIDLPVCDALTSQQKGHIVAIINEALTNIVRHSRAKHVLLAATCKGEIVEIKIQDDGIGVTGNPKAGFGLRNMHDRARLLGGGIDIHNEDGKGTTVCLSFPWEEKA